MEKEENNCVIGVEAIEAFNKFKQKEEYEGWKIVSDMLDNPDKNGIYPTTKCYKELYQFVLKQKENAIAEYKKELTEKVNKMYEGFMPILEYRSPEHDGMIAKGIQEQTIDKVLALINGK